MVVGGGGEGKGGSWETAFTKIFLLFLDWLITLLLYPNLPLAFKSGNVILAFRYYLEKNGNYNIARVLLSLYKTHGRAYIR